MSELVKQDNSLKGLMANPAIKQRFAEMLKDRAGQFITSVLSLQNSSPQLQKSEPMSVLNCAMVAASLDLPVNPNLGFAYIIPYGNQAQFQIGYKGLIQLALRSGQYQLLNTSEVYEGELISENRMTGELIFDSTKKTSEKIIGYVAFFRLNNGFEKSLYSTVEQLEKHGKKFSQTYKKGFGIWKDDFDSMAKKTVLKLLISKYGILSIEMQNAIEKDQATINDEGNVAGYVDNEITIDITDASAKRAEASESTKLFDDAKE